MTCKSLLLGRDSIIGFMVFKVKFKLSKVYLLKVVKQFIKLSHKDTMKSLSWLVSSAVPTIHDGGHVLFLLVLLTIPVLMTFTLHANYMFCMYLKY